MSRFGGPRRYVPVAAALLAVTAGSTTRAASDDWKADANDRIEQIRKRDVSILVVDRLGVPVVNAAVTAEQLRHGFAFGSCINTNVLGNPTYAEFFTNHFEWAVLENEAKWFLNEPMQDFVTFAGADGILDFCEQNGILVRGHNIFWAKEQYTPVWSRSLPDGEFHAEVEERLDDAVPHFRGRFLHWDVNNEMLDGDYFRRRLGADIEPWMFVRAHELDPDALLFPNDYSILAGSVARTDAYIQQIENLRAAGAPIHAVGVQGHFWGDTVSPYQILDRLDRLSVLGLPVWVTEYDAVDPDDAGRAEKLENLYRAAFSHPVVDGILMWGFWAGSHWRGPDAAIVDEDWTVNAAGVRYESLLAEWTTDAAGTTGAEGRFGFRGFHGTYRFEVAAGSTSPGPITAEVPPGEGQAEFLIPLKPGACFAAGEVRELRLSRGAAGQSVLSWRPLPFRADMGSVYDTLRSGDPADFDASAACLESDDGTDARADEPADPAPGESFFYLVRGAYECPKGEGGLGVRSDGTLRVGRDCR